METGEKISNTKYKAVVTVTILILIVIGVISTKTGNFPVSIASQAITPIEQSVLLAPPKTPTEEGSYDTLVQKYAQEAQVLDVGAECAVSPLVLKLKSDALLTIRNNDTVSHMIAFEDQNAFSVSVGQTRTLSLQEMFQKGAGTYRYRCGDKMGTGNVGVLYIVP